VNTKVKELIDLKERVEELPKEATAEIATLKQLIAKLESDPIGKLTAWENVQLARHADRPYTLDFISRLFTSFRPIQGDRKFRDDPAMIGGMALFEGQPVMVIGQQKGRNTKERLYRNYGMAKPEGNFVDYYAEVQERLKELPTTMLILAAEEISFGEVLMQNE